MIPGNDGNVSCGENVACGDGINGDVKCGVNIKCKTIERNVERQGNLIYI